MATQTSPKSLAILRPWHLGELCEAVETLANRHGYKRPQYMPYARATVKRALQAEADRKTRAGRMTQWRDDMQRRA